MDLSPLRKYPDFRRLWTGTAFSTLGFQVSAMAVALQIFAMTHSTFAVGAVGLVSVAPLVLGGLYGGVIADAADRRVVALTASVALWFFSGLIAVQAFLHLDSVAVLYALIACQSFCHPINQAARGAIVPQLVSASRLPAANALNMAASTVSLTLGPMIGGFLVASVGYGWTYLVDVLTFTVGLWALFRLPAQPPVRHQEDEPASRGLRSVLEGFAFVRRSPVVAMTFLLDLCAMVFLFPQALFPAMAMVVVGGNEAVAGMLSGTMTFGAFLGTLLSGRFVKVAAQGRALTWSYVGWTAGMMVAGLAIWWVQIGTMRGSIQAWTGLVVCLLGLMFAGAVDSIGSIYRSTILQVAAPDRMRGRLQGLFIVTVTGGPRIGQGLTGAAGQLAGPGLALVYGAIACGLGVAGLTKKFPQLMAYRAQAAPETTQLETVPEAADPDRPATGPVHPEAGPVRQAGRTEEDRQNG